MTYLGHETFDSLDDLFLHQLEDLYDAEQRMVAALPEMRDAATDPALKEAFDKHCRETEEQVVRLERAFQSLGKEPSREACEAMKGLIREAEEMRKAKGDDTVRDVALVAAAQRVEHYEIAAYGTARTLATHLGYADVAEGLAVTLEEERNADSSLTELAESQLNPAAAA